jgi:uncharacterized RDD family membrane protein YckC
MKWYYAVNRERIGPVEDQEFERLVREGTITSATLVWNQDLPNWTKLTDLPDFPGKDDVTPEIPGFQDSDEKPPKKGQCTECGRYFPEDELVRFEGSTVCSGCKPLFIQKIREGANTAGLVYAGFWIRFAAKFIDGLIVSAVNFVISLAMAGLMASSVSDPVRAFQSTMAIASLKTVINACYCTYFLGKFSATPGKMVCGLKVVTPDNHNVTYMTGLGRFFAEFLSAIILGIGYLMMIPDPEKRTLHDRICNTRVIRTR